MEEKTSKPLPTLLIIFLIGLAFVSSFCRADIDGVAGNENISEESNLKTYIVFVRKPEGEVLETHQSLAGWYRSFLPDTISSGNHQRRMVYTYKNVVSGFAVKLTAEEARAMEEKDGFVSAKPERVLPLHTTHSPNFLGLYENFGLWRGSNYGEGVIIGVLDTGVTPDHPSFCDEGLPSPPKKWKGKCEFSGTMCNKKLIGARNFVTPEKPAKPEPPFDEEGHGTHTASTAAGNFVKNADVFGNANGTAVGMAPLAHLAIYKVCDDFGCSESDILAAMDTAVEDGVDVLSLSLGGFSAPFYDDAIAVGAFGAIQQGIFVSCSAGNSGPENFTLSNEAPWILTVGASTIDRSIRATVMLGNGQQFFGESLYQPEVTTASLLPLVYAGQNGSQSAALCGPGSLDKIDVKGRIVLCERGGGIARIQKGQVVKDAGGAGMILMNEQPDGYSTLADAHVLPASHVSYAAGTIIKAYINSTSSPIAQFLFQGTIIGVKTAPMVASFSSRGPSYASPGILSGIAALLKSAHPSWSPAAIKSAIMTTAGLLNVGGGPILDERYLPADILATGAGHVNPAKASDPGLVYDIHPDDYIPYLCGLSYTDREITYIVQRKVKCSEFTAIPEAQLNYPSFSIVFGNETQTYTRTVTNVGPNNLIYSVLISPPPGVNVTVSPSQLVFTNSKQTATYTVTFTKLSQGYSGKPFSQGSLTWFSQHYSVRSPIQALFSLPE